LLLAADCLSSIAMLLPARSDKDLISGRAMRTTTAIAAVPRSATAVAAATCACVALARESIATSFAEGSDEAEMSCGAQLARRAGRGARRAAVVEAEVVDSRRRVDDAHALRDPGAGLVEVVHAGDISLG